MSSNATNPLSLLGPDKRATSPLTRALSYPGTHRARYTNRHGEINSLEETGTMQRTHDQACADCGTHSANLLCDRCAEICDILTPAGEYYTYRTALRCGRIRPLVPRATADQLLTSVTSIGQSGHA